ncbi:thioesterase family protein [Rhodococcus rhodnii]|uniref:Acyl-CoA thioesterase n=2 Tax=Rhodococcus rhodnii TaxID=38312 RepID=R7WJ08_9NOCA|nr:thioesterase family protein [Rhodococcus rhodnii]EOM75247.1 hypothetical protein Rrhod_3468 [Rhodococcus rhodnii LMG 5362]TXG89264.1 thioesterase family protein [Rhodococcus rhodnii]
MSDAPTAHPFDAALQLEPTAAPGAYRAHTSPAYNNMVGPFGGMTAATLVGAVQSHPDVLGDPLSLTVNYAGAIAEGELDIAVTPARTNRTNQHWNLEISQNGEITTTATAVFGLRRETWTDTEVTPPEAPEPTTIDRAGFPEFIAWARNYDLRFVAGGLSERQSPHPDSISTMWIRDEPVRPLDFTSLTAMCDAFYPRAFLRRGTYLPAGTVTFTVYFHATSDELAAHGDDYLLATARAQRFGKGYFDQTGELWSHDGTLLATTHQLVYFKADNA